MLPEFILKEERKDNLGLLFALSTLSGLFGFGAASLVFPSEVAIISVVFASVPLVYPLTRFFLEEEEKKPSHLDQLSIYGVLFAGQASAFFIAASIYSPENFSAQITTFACSVDDFGIQAVAGVQLENLVDTSLGCLSGPSGRASSPGLFFDVLSNNLFLFAVILLVSALVSSAGAFILTWNASVLGVFFAVLARKLSGSSVLTGNENIPSPLAYLPHTAFEISGFILAGISGTIISAAVYRKHFDRETWEDISLMILAGLSAVVTGAGLESGAWIAFLIGLAGIVGAAFFFLFRGK
jgi:uncharacterized membrane protein SpoIIM required for sporulation